VKDPHSGREYYTTAVERSSGGIRFRKDAVDRHAEELRDHRDIQGSIPSKRRHEKREVSADLAHHTARLACSGELVDTGSFGLAVSRALGGVLIEFVCPRCDELHESHLFR
jgi:hypothetical protein